jgi:hypothetical protein
MATTVAHRRRVEMVLRWLSVIDFSSYGGGVIWGAHLGGFTARSGGVGRAQQWDRELDLRWCRDLAPVDGWSQDRLKRLRRLRTFVCLVFSEPGKRCSCATMEGGGG